MNEQENLLICKCKKVYLADIERVLHERDKFEDVEKEFNRLQEETECSTGCGGCHDKVMQIVSQIIG